MRHYQPDSANAAARIISAALLADGSIDKSETDLLARSRMIERLGLSEDEFDKVLMDYCNDLQMSANYMDSSSMRLSPETLEAMLDEVRDPTCQEPLLRALFEIAGANGVWSPDEAALVSKAMEKWGGSERWPVKIVVPTESAELRP